MAQEQADDGFRREQITETLRDDIIRGRLAPGERLVEETIAREYGVSRVPVREAFRRLETEGFITIAKYQGAVVSTTSERDTLEMMQTRRALEVMAARLAAERKGGGLGDQLQTVLDRGTQAAKAHRIGELPDLIMSFHELVAHASGNQYLQNTIHRLLQRISWGFELDIDKRLDSSWLDHTLIASAIINGSSLQAGLLMDEHILKDELLYKARIPSDDA